MNHDSNTNCRTFQNLGEYIGEKYLQDLGVGKESLDLMAKKQKENNTKDKNMIKWNSSK